jgi:sulfotransferase family protein
MQAEVCNTPKQPRGDRKNKAPVFVLGCGRSGTKFLYHTLMSAGGFAVYFAESNAFNLLGLRFGNLAHRGNRQKLLSAWLKSKLFQRSGLKPEEIEPRILEECRNAGDFLRILMETIARKQHVDRWAESTPLHLLYLPLIKKLIPEALVIHIIRDGRDVALSLDKMGWIRPYPWDRGRSLVTAGLFWKWIVSKGRKYGRTMGRDYVEIHYEDLVSQPRDTLARLSAFIDHDLDYNRIQTAALGSVQMPNSSFKTDQQHKGLSPVGRWKTLLCPADIAELESAIGDLLVKVGYPLVTPQEEANPTAAIHLMRVLYPAVFNLKFWLKSNTPFGRMADVGRMGIADAGEAQ